MRGRRRTEHRYEEPGVRRLVENVPLPIHIHDQHLARLLIVGADRGDVRAVPVALHHTLVEVDEDDVVGVCFVCHKRLPQLGQCLGCGVHGTDDLDVVILKLIGREATIATNSVKVTPLPSSATSSAQFTLPSFVSNAGWVTTASSAPCSSPRTKLRAMVMLASEQALDVCCGT